jgi:hypothetical protein
VINRLVESDRAFQTWVEDTTEAVAARVRTQVERLLAFPNVVVVLTQYHNPVNHDSVIFRASDQILKTTCNGLFSPGKCYRRTEDAIHALNEAFASQVIEPLGSPTRLRITPNLHEAFHEGGGHEGPGVLGAFVGPGPCGFAPPGIANTWVQWLGDPTSNSFSFLGALPVFPDRGFAGDCFHPNEAGAQEFANAVSSLALDLLQTGLLIAPGLSADEVLSRAQAAIHLAGSYRYQRFDVAAGRSLVWVGEVDLEGEAATSIATDGSVISYRIGSSVYSRRSNADWSSREEGPFHPDDPLYHAILDTEVGTPTWVVQGREVIEGQEAIVLSALPNAEATVPEPEQTLWIDAATNLPIKLLQVGGGSPGAYETVYADFGTPVDIQVPPEALAPNLSVDEVVGRAQAAVREAGTYRYELYSVEPAGRNLTLTGEVDIANGTRQVDETGTTYYITAIGRRFTEQEDGTLLDTTPASGAFAEILIQFVNQPATDWTLLGEEEVEGRDAYLIQETFTWKMWEIEQTLWIDAESFLPLKAVGRNDQNDNYGETFYSDFGAPVDVEVPPEAMASKPSPEPITVAVPSGSEPQDVAEGFLQAAMAWDFDAALQFFAPDEQPAAWYRVFGWDELFPEYVNDDLSGCSGVGYQVVERVEGSSAAITFLFDTDCAMAQLSFREASDFQLQYNLNDQDVPAAVPTNEVVVFLENSTGRWFVEFCKTEAHF